MHRQRHSHEHLLYCCSTVNVSGADGGAPPKKDPAKDVESDESFHETLTCIWVSFQDHRHQPCGHWHAAAGGSSDKF